MRPLRHAYERMRISTRYTSERTQVVIGWIVFAVLYLVITVLDDNTHGFWHQAVWAGFWAMTGAGALVVLQHRRR